MLNLLTKIVRRCCLLFGRSSSMYDYHFKVWALSCGTNLYDSTTYTEVLVGDVLVLRRYLAEP